MNPIFVDATDPVDLVNELDSATEMMMALHAGQIGGERWNYACSRQDQAFRAWRDYLSRKADEKPSRWSPSFA
jgi:hypothetical protein